MASHQTDDSLSVGNKSGLWGALIGLIVAAFIAVPLSAAVSFATHPATRQLFAGRLSEATQGGYQIFWWAVALLLAALPFLIGFGVAKLSARTLVTVGAIIGILLILIVVLGSAFVF